MADLITITPPGALDTATKSFAGAKATFFNAGTTTPRTVYSDEALSVPHASPLVAGADGLWPEIFASGLSVKAVVTYSDNTAAYTLDPAPRSLSTGSTAGEITFTPTTNYPYNNVQDAIELGAYPSALVTADAAAFLIAGDMADMRDTLGAADATEILGVGQTPTDVLASRVGSTSYQNTTGRPIVVALYGRSVSSSTAVALQLSANGVTWLDWVYLPPTVDPRANAAIIVGVGQYYRLNGAATNVTSWKELR